MSAEETPRERAARRLLALAALKKIIVAEEAAVRAEEGATFTKGGQREVAELPDGTPLGNVRLDPAKPSYEVTDPEAWLAYVEQVAPEHVVTRTIDDVSPAYTKAVLADLVHGSETFVNRITGEVSETPPGVTYDPGSTRLVVTPSKAAPAAVRALLGAQGTTLGMRAVTNRPEESATLSSADEATSGGGV